MNSTKININLKPQNYSIEHIHENKQNKRMLFFRFDLCCHNISFIYILELDLQISTNLIILYLSSN